MSKTTNSPPKLRKSGDYACVYLNGRRIRLGKWDTADARKNYLQFLSEWANLKAAAGTPGNGRATVDELALGFLTYKKGKCGESDYNNYRTALETLIQIYSGTPVGDFGCSKLDNVRNQFVERGYSRGHCNKLTGLIKTAFSWGVNKEIVPAPVYQTLRCLKPLMQGQTTAHEDDPVEAVPDEVIQRTLPYLPPIIADMVKAFEEIENLNDKYKPNITILDYAQRIKTNNNFKTTLERMNYLCNSCRAYVQKYECCIIVICSCDKESSKSKTHLFSARDSSEFGFSPEIVIGLDRTEKKTEEGHPVLEANFHKKRYLEDTPFYLAFDGRHCSFRPVSLNETMVNPKSEKKK